MGEFGEDGVEERGGDLGDIGGHSLEEEQYCFHWLREGEREGGSEMEGVSE